MDPVLQAIAQHTQQRVVVGVWGWGWGAVGALSGVPFVRDLQAHAPLSDGCLEQAVLHACAPSARCEWRWRCIVGKVTRRMCAPFLRVREHLHQLRCWGAMSHVRPMPRCCYHNFRDPGNAAGPNAANHDHHRGQDHPVTGSGRLYSS